jgi:hypothetical protein
VKHATVANASRRQISEKNLFVKVEACSLSVHERVLSRRIEFSKREIIEYSDFRSAAVKTQLFMQMLTQNDTFHATDLLPILECTKVHACAAFTWIKTICTVSSIGRASDS